MWRRGLLRIGAALWFLATVVVGVGLPRSASGQGIRLFTEFEYLTSDLEEKNRVTGEKSETSFQRFEHRYNLDVRRRLYPFLELRAGGQFEQSLSETETDGAGSDRDEQEVQPFAGVAWDTGLYSAGAEYRRTNESVDVSGAQDTAEIRDQYTLDASYSPAGLPAVRGFYTRNHNRDRPRTTETVTESTFLESSYEYRNLGLVYSFNRLETENRIEDFRSEQTFHDITARYARRFLDDRLSMNTRYSFQYTTNEFGGQGSGEFPVSRAAGLFSIDDSPEDGPALEPAPALVDGILDTSAGIPIGTGGDPLLEVNLGLEIASGRPVDTLHLWVDREVTPSVASAFTWRIYTSPDNNDQSVWSLHAVVDSARFGPFDNRFEISFPPVESRFIKVVTRPLGATVPGATEILVTELEALQVVPADEVENPGLSEHSYNLGLVWKISPATTLSYDLFYRQQEQLFESEDDTVLTNGVVVSHRFNRLFSGGARLLRTDSDRALRDETTYDYSASLRAQYLPTLRQTLTYSGVLSQAEEQEDTRTDSVVLRTSADLYRGWSAYLDLGYNRQDLATTGEIESQLLRVGTSIVPNRKVDVNVDYTLRQTRGDEGGGEDRQTLNARLLFVPLRTLSLFAELSAVREEGEWDWLQEYTTSWSPFPDGTVQLAAVYNERRTSEGDRVTTYGPSVRWEATSYALLTASYSVVETERRLTEESVESLSLNLRLTY